MKAQTPKVPRLMLSMVFVVVILLVTAGVFLSSSTPPVTPTPQPTATLTATATVAPAEANPPCVWQWASQPLPAVGEAVKRALKLAGAGDIGVRAEAYGENCLKGTAGAAYFAAMTTDFYITLSVEETPDRAALGALSAQVYRQLLPILDALTLPARLGWLDITFEGAASPARTRLMFDDIARQIEAGQPLEEVLAP